MATDPDTTNPSRRSILAGVGSLTLLGTPASAAPDPIIDAIKAYRAGMAAYDEHPINTIPGGGTKEQEAAAVAATYGPPLDALENWDQPAVSRQGAIAALRLVLDGAVDFYLPDESEAMVKAVLRYLEANT